MKRIVLVAFVLVCLVATVLTLGVASHAAATPYTTVVEDGTTYYKYEAENGVLGGQAQNGGTNVGWLGGGDNGTVTITVTSDKAGLATIYVAYATFENRSMAVTVNGTTKEFSSLNNGSWSEFAEVSFTAELVEGENTVVIGGVGTGNAPNVDYILVSEVIELSDDPDAAIPNDALDSTLTPGDRDYVFYAQTRTNRQNAANTDVRIICVAKQSWLDSIPNFVATFTFTDGTTPVELKSVGLDTVFKSITAYGTDGNVETYTAAEGAVIFGWIITEVPEAYANVVTNTPKATVVTDAGVEPDVKPGVDYETSVQSNTTINVETDGVYKSVETDINGKVGGFDNETSKATYILSGNYEGYYDMKISYTDMNGRRLGVLVNGVAHVVKVEDTTSSWDDVNTAKSMTITVKMKKGVNVISFMRTDDFGFNLVDFDLTKNTTYTLGDAIEVGVEAYTSIDGAAIENCTHGTKKVGWLGVDNGVNRTITYTVDIPADGKYYVSLGYLYGGDPNRKFSFSVDGGEGSAVRIVKGESNDDETYALETVFYVDLTAGKHTITIGGYDGWAPNLMGMTFAQVVSE